MLQALGDGIMEAAVACRYESVQLPEKQNADFMARYMASVNAALDTLEKITLAEKATIGEIAIACALGYLDFRYAALGWRDTHPKLATWYNPFAKYPAMVATAPPAV
jgi:glutathione S-transferase